MELLLVCIVSLGVAIFGGNWAAARPPSHAYWWGFFVTAALWCLAAYAISRTCALPTEGPCVSELHLPKIMAGVSLYYFFIGWTLPFIAFVFATWQSLRKLQQRTQR